MNIDICYSSAVLLASSKFVSEIHTWSKEVWVTSIGTFQIKSIVSFPAKLRILNDHLSRRQSLLTGWTGAIHIYIYYSIDPLCSNKSLVNIHKTIIDRRSRGKRTWNCSYFIKIFFSVMHKKKGKLLFHRKIIFHPTVFIFNTIENQFFIFKPWWLDWNYLGY